MRILVLRPGALGDVLLTVPALRALQGRFPGAHIEVMGNLSVLGLLPSRSVVSAVSSFDRVDLAGLFQPEGEPSELLRSYLDAFDLILSYATAADHLFAHNLERASSGRVLHFDPWPVPGSGMHMTEYLQQPLPELGVPVSTEPPRLNLTESDRQQAGKWWEDRGLGDAIAVAIHPGSGSAAKNWPAQRFAAVAAHLHHRGWRILLIRGPADELAAWEVQGALHEQEYILLDSLPLHLLAAMLTLCRTYVGNDSGISHLAAAVGAPTAVVFGPTDPQVWAPRGEHVRVVRGRAACAPCSREEQQTCRRPGCLEAVSVEAVLRTIGDLCSGVR
jgi:ADP-heptose:LPS heptosyltransferase